MECIAHKRLVLMMVAVMVMMTVIVVVSTVIILTVVTCMATAGFGIMFMCLMSIRFLVGVYTVEVHLHRYKLVYVVLIQR